ncbi:unnamed protein product (mitochondrion) [Plasmodiophora brassicae]|uniref:Uncharacterized protein n=1 Tax=Plasmodiophora brassicae TaxID=37360 RepID=A0A0G4IHE2_PLABS|nr:hypothetical protein PBRA_000317 [Plasmodiophora brassicae]SPQ96878.1 unnamed protein product [Plasmodiophora brassicae]
MLFNMPAPPAEEQDTAREMTLPDLLLMMADSDATPFASVCDQPAPSWNSGGDSLDTAGSGFMRYHSSEYQAMYPPAAPSNDVLASGGHRLVPSAMMPTTAFAQTPFVPMGQAPPASSATGAGANANDVVGRFPGDWKMKGKIEFKPDVTWPERARVKQILNGEAQNLPVELQKQFLEAHGITASHQLWPFRA